MRSEFESAAASDSRPAAESAAAASASASPASTAPPRRIRLERCAPLTPNAWLRYDVVQRILPPKITSVLEVGCGQGALGVRLSARYRYLGLEPDPESFRVAQGRFTRLGRGEVRRTTVQALDPGERFDLVCAFEVLEHIEDDADALRQWAGRLGPGGWLLLSVPAHQRRYGAADRLVGHFRRYDPDALAGLVRQVGFGDVEVREYGAPLGYALEAGRNAVGRRRLVRISDVSMQKRTGASGRLLQPGNPLVSALARYGTFPFRYVQRALPHGPGLVLRAKLPGAR